MTLSTTQKHERIKDHFSSALESAKDGTIALRNTVAESETLPGRIGQVATAAFAVSGIAARTGSDSVKNYAWGTGLFLSLVSLGLKVFQQDHKLNTLTSENTRLKASLQTTSSNDSIEENSSISNNSAKTNSKKIETSTESNIQSKTSPAARRAWR